ncbi:hypothetical protein HOLleu_10623 [Holothuria leucospilota]|uniref:Uncharacterized protein n=1 Tax=Holothuria leucospilota TaxID=206669 RepID=A0A9Q1CEA7_HOLLE|nr:hypothetical protein HOLleu_10623 [Holothuria leucospilota]
MFSARVLLLLILFGAVAIIASSPLREPSDKEEFDLRERSLDRLFKRQQREEEHHPEDEDDEDIDELEARVAKPHPFAATRAVASARGRRYGVYPWVG